MILIENEEVMGFEPAIRGMRNPKNSWDQSDSSWDGMIHAYSSGGIAVAHNPEEDFSVGPKDHYLMFSLSNAGPVHAKYRRMINVYVDITAPLYWWKEFDTYKVGTVANSCSTMHKIHGKEFVIGDFSHEHLLDAGSYDDSIKTPMIDVSPYGDGSMLWSPKGILEQTIRILNLYRDLYLKADQERAYNDCNGADSEKNHKFLAAMKIYWWQMIQLLPSTYNQKRTIMMSYETLTNIYDNRRNHKLDEWRELCVWIEGLPLSDIITKNYGLDNKKE